MREKSWSTQHLAKYDSQINKKLIVRLKNIRNEIILENLCTMCYFHKHETLFHLFVECPFYIISIEDVVGAR